MLVKCLQICAHVFIDRPQNCAQTSFRSCAGWRPNFGHSRSELCPIMTCRSRAKLCPNFGCSHARLCPVSFSPCPFPNLAVTLLIRLLLYNQSGVFYFSWYRHQVEGPAIFSVLSEKTRAITGEVFCPGTRARVTDRPGFERMALESSVRLADHPSTAPHYDNRLWSCPSVATHRTAGRGPPAASGDSRCR